MNAIDEMLSLPNIDIVIPVYNEEACMPELISRLLKLRANFLGKINLNFYFVDDGSVDSTPFLLQEIADRYSFFKVVEFSRNFGHQIAVTAGIDATSSEWVAIIDADLQDPPEMIIDMYEIACGGFQVVYGVRVKRPGESVFKLLSARLFYRIMQRISDTPLPLDVGDFRLMSRDVVRVLNQMREKHRYLRGMIPWVGFKSAPFYYVRDIRIFGKTKYPIIKMAAFALNAIFSFSSKPLTLAIRIGIVIILLGFAWTLYAIYLRVFTGIPVPGFTALLCAILIFSGTQIFLLGVMGEYIGRIFEEVKDRPLYVVSKKINI